MQARSPLPIGSALVLLGLLVGLAGSFVDNLLGASGFVTALQVLLWLGGGTIVLAGAASTVALRTGQRAEAGRSMRPTQ